jgi:hypothetical protein
MMITRELLRSLTFKPFSQNDYYGFAGVESPLPMIAETDTHVFVLDGGYCEMYDADCEMVDSVDDIRSLK